MLFLGKCFDPSTAYQYLFPSEYYLVLRFPFFSTFPRMSLLTTLSLYPLFPTHIHLLFPTSPSQRRVSESSSFLHACWEPDSLRERDGIRDISLPFARQADHLAPSRLTRSRVQPLILLFLFHTPFPYAQRSSILSTPLLRSISYIAGGFALIDKAWCVRRYCPAVSTFGEFTTRWWHAKRFFI